MLLITLRWGLLFTPCTSVPFWAFIYDINTDLTRMIVTHSSGHRSQNIYYIVQCLTNQSYRESHRHCKEMQRAKAVNSSTVVHSKHGYKICHNMWFSYKRFYSKQSHFKMLIIMSNYIFIHLFLLSIMRSWE